MIYGSVCSGIEAATVAWEPLGWRPAFFSEIEAFPRAVLAHRWPEVKCHGDFTTIQAGQYDPIDLLVGGTPCQSFSVAGLRGGLDDDRGNLALEYLRLADRLRPRWLVWENVPGVLSSNGGRDFGSILGGMGELGYGVAYRVLDAQYVRTHEHPRAVPQRRRRVFVVGYSGDWRASAAVLFEAHSLSGNPAPRRETGKASAERTGFDSVGSVSGGYGAKLGTDESCQGSVIPFDTTQITSAANYSAPQPGDPCHPLASGAHPPAIAFAIQERAVCENADAGPDGAGFREGVAYTLEARSQVQGVATPNTVRRLTPRECERLQGFPDDWTAVPYRKGMAADGPRYKALGNSMAVPCMVWLGQRIQQVEDICSSAKAAA